MDPKDNGQYYYYFKFFLSSLLKGVEGDAIEAGVFRGKSLISAALILKKLRKIKNLGV